MNAVSLHRVAHWAHVHRVPLLPTVFYRLTVLMFGSAIEPGAQIGRGSYCAHAGLGIVIGDGSVIGSDVIIGQGCTVGGRGRPDSAGGLRHGMPVIGNGVYIGPGARILGPIRVGRQAVIGANAVVITDVPPYAVMGGVPARVIRIMGAEEASADPPRPD